MKGAPYSESDVQVLRNLYADKSTDLIAQMLGRPVSSVYRAAFRLGLRKSAAFLASEQSGRMRSGHHGGRTTQFKKGQVPANKGLRRPGFAPGRMAATQFKPGERRGVAADNWSPVGTISTDTDGYLRIKVREGRKGEASGFGNTRIWPFLSRYTWEQHNGPIPPGHMIVFRDGDRSNCAIENLEIVTRAENIRRNTIHNRYPKEMVDTIMLLGAVKRKVREYAERHNDRSAQPSL